MSSKERGMWFYLSAWLPVLIAIGVIAIESTEWLGANETSGPLRWVYEHLLGVVDDMRWGEIHHYLRKSGHFLGYGTMALLWLRAWWITLPRSRFIQDALLALLGTGLVATSDEWHQSFLPNRTATPWDVLLDCCGAIVLQLLVYVFMRVARPKRLARAA